MRAASSAALYYLSLSQSSPFVRVLSRPSANHFSACRIHLNERARCVPAPVAYWAAADFELLPLPSNNVFRGRHSNDSPLAKHPCRILRADSTHIPA